MYYCFLTFFFITFCIAFTSHQITLSHQFALSSSSLSATWLGAPLSSSLLLSLQNDWRIKISDCIAVQCIRCIMSHSFAMQSVFSISHCKITCKITGPRRFMFNKIVNITHYHHQIRYHCSIKIKLVRLCVKTSARNGQHLQKLH